jgi:hypothetical protein
MPVFLADMVAKGFWWVWLAYLIIGIPLGVLVMIFQKINKILGIIGIVIQYTVTVYFLFYVRHVRGHVFWLICAILGIIGFLSAVATAIIRRPAAPPGGETPAN